MAWPDPPLTWIAGQVVTAAQLIAQLRDALKAIGDPWTAGTATFSATGGGFALGNGTVSAAYSTAGKRNTARVMLNVGSTTSFGTGRLQCTLGGGIPLGVANRGAGYAVYNDQSAPLRYSGAVYFATSTVLEIAGPTGNVTATAPFTWANTDWLAIGMSWESP